MIEKRYSDPILREIGDFYFPGVTVSYFQTDFLSKTDSLDLGPGGGKWHGGNSGHGIVVMKRTAR